MTSSAPSQPSQIPLLVPAPAGWIYLGCYLDDRSRILHGGYRDAQDMTVISCISICQGNGFSIAGVERASECFCGNSIRADAIQKTETECARGCSGDASQRCGDIWRLNLYQAQSGPTAHSSSSTATASLPSNASIPQAPASSPPPPTSIPSSIAPITSTGSSTSAQPSSTTITNISETTVFTHAHSTYFPSASNISATTVILPPPSDQVFAPDDNYSRRPSPSSGAIAGIVVGAIILVAFLILLAWQWKRRKVARVTMRQHVSMPVPYYATTYTDTHADSPPAYGDSKANVESTAYRLP
ncbi:hypothetical protein CVT24_011411 [Panaeolus cyanescens]|uniref:WSC domain-containing protein n=1 Tax=Panaeolus cyanescens TaxID=181874 RepID=A0A409VG97_9AGAR|nr:hypothetical protein CVT24_011411 [Panaeolus cyanescens]